MLDINLIRENPQVVIDALTKRNMDTNVVAELTELDVQRRSILQEVEVLKAERNRVSKEIKIKQSGMRKLPVCVL